MNDEKFELTICDLAGSGTYYADIADELRARDTAQREALARVEAEHEANRLELGEALILIGQVLDCRTLEDLNPVRRYLNEFVDRYSLRPVPDVDLVQAEHQEAQGAQAGDEREAFEAWHRGRFGTKSQTGDPTRDMHNGVKAEEYGPEEQQIRWECWQARAALATQPATIKLPDRKRTDHLPAEYKTMTPTRASIESYNRALDDVAALNAVPALGDKPTAYVNYDSNGKPYLDWVPSKNGHRALFEAGPAAEVKS